MGPEHGKEKIAINNYDGNPATFKRMIKNGKVDVAIQFKLNPDDSILDKVGRESNRDIWLYDGDLQVDKKYQPWVIDVESQDGQEVYSGAGTQIMPYIE